MNGFAILGSQNHLSLAELETVISQKAFNTSKELALFENTEEFDQQLINRLGGTQKLGHIIESRIHPSEEGLIDIMHDHIVHLGKSGKVLFGINMYSMDGGDRFQKLKKQKQRIGILLKKQLRASGTSSRFVVTKNENLSSADYVKTGLQSKGVEFHLIVKEKHVDVGITTAVQDFEDWSHRDYDRPGRDARRGMLPPKLARMMINLSRKTPESSTLLDPFCGSGTVLMEASMLNFTQLLGTDISHKAVEDTETNLEWLTVEGYDVPPFHLHQSTAANTHAVIDSESVDCIVTEPFLGNPRKGNESEEQVEEAIEELTQLYKESFATLVKLLKPGGTMVVASPIHYIREQAYPVPTTELLENLGLKNISTHGEIIYKREGQFVGRNILQFKK